MKVQSYYQAIVKRMVPVEVMLDIETMGKGSNAPIVAIGAVEFDLLTGETGAEFERVISLNSSQHYGDIDASTVLWWMNQSKEAREIFLKETPKTNLRGALIDLNKWLGEVEQGYKKAHVWGNGSNFDNVITRNAFDAVKVYPGFSPFHDMDCRTIVRMGKEILGIEPKLTIKRDGTHHRALDDAKFQAAYVSAIWREFIELRKSQKVNDEVRKTLKRWHRSGLDNADGGCNG